MVTHLPSCETRHSVASAPCHARQDLEHTFLVFSGPHIRHAKRTKMTCLCTERSQEARAGDWASTRITWYNSLVGKQRTRSYDHPLSGQQTGAAHSMSTPLMAGISAR